MTIGASAQAQRTEAPAESGPLRVRAFGATGATSPLGSLQIQRRALRSNDVLIDILYCGICHSDIHTARGEWEGSRYPCVPGHEIVGRVRAVGGAVTKFKVGDLAGVGTMVDSCGACENCLADREQNCVNSATFTYNSPDHVSEGHTFGGYSDKIVVAEHFVIRIPPARTWPPPRRCCAPASRPSRRCSTGSFRAASASA